MPKVAQNSLVKVKQFLSEFPGSLNRIICNEVASIVEDDLFYCCFVKAVNILVVKMQSVQQQHAALS